MVRSPIGSGERRERSASLPIARRNGCTPAASTAFISEPGNGCGNHGPRELADELSEFPCLPAAGALRR